MTRKLTNEECIARIKDIHGDLYDCSLVEYVNQSTKIKLICRDHGIFEKIPANIFSRKEGCQRCARLLERTTEEFVRRVTEIHGDFYDYSEVVYTTNSTKVAIGCPECGRVFYQTPASHLAGCKCTHCYAPRKKDNG